MDQVLSDESNEPMPWLPEDIFREIESVSHQLESKMAVATVRDAAAGEP
ncbi:hypothetical protein [Mesorhizobium sp. ORM16]